MIVADVFRPNPSESFPAGRERVGTFEFTAQPMIGDLLSVRETGDEHHPITYKIADRWWNINPADRASLTVIVVRTGTLR